VRIFERNDTTALWVESSNVPGDLPGDLLGYSVACSRNGLTFATGGIAFGDVSQSFGVVKVARYNAEENAWNRLGNNILSSQSGENFGNSVAISDDGRTVAIGIPFRNPKRMYEAGAVEVYHLDSGSTAWTPYGSTLEGTAPGDEFGLNVAISGDGTVLAVGASQFRATEKKPGYVRVFRFTDGDWVQMGNDIGGEAPGDQAGWHVSLSQDGTIVAVASQTARSSRGSTTMYEYTDDGVWHQLGQILVGKKIGDEFGSSIDLSNDGQDIVVGAWRADATEILPNYVQVFRLSADRTVWNQVGNVLEKGKARGGAEFVNHGLAVSINGDGMMIAMGYMYENSDEFSNAGEVVLYHLETGDEK
jgi:hypothetical protein